MLRKRWISGVPSPGVPGFAQSARSERGQLWCPALAYRLKGLHAAIVARPDSLFNHHGNCLLAAFVLNVDPDGVIGGALAGFSTTAIGLTLANTWLIGHGNLRTTTGPRAGSRRIPSWC